jgi:hypothetical protein
MKALISVLTVILFVTASHASDTGAAQGVNLATSPKTATPELTRNLTLTAPVGVLAERTLQSLAPSFTEVERPTFIGMRGPNPPLTVLAFATTPENAGYPGLCKATVIFVDFDPVNRTETADSDSPAVAKSIDTETVFKVVDDPSPLPDMWNDQYGAKLEGECKKAGRVIPSESGNFGEVAFFSLRDTPEYQAWLAVRTLQLAITKAGSPALPKIKCLPVSPIVDRPPECANPSNLMHALDLAKLITVSFRPCPKNPQRYCTTAEFLRWGQGNMQKYWQVDIEAKIKIPDRADADVSQICAITVSDAVMIAD